MDDLNYQPKFAGFCAKIQPGDLQPDNIPPLVLAYVGDAVYELYVRTALLSYEHLKVRKLHGLAIDLVKAGAQSNLLSCLDDMLREEEKDIVRRGRNAKNRHSAKNASKLVYNRSTGFEALIGHLYLKGDFDRIQEILAKSVQMVLRSENAGGNMEGEDNEG